MMPDMTPPAHPRHSRPLGADSFARPAAVPPPDAAAAWSASFRANTAAAAAAVTPVGAYVLRSHVLGGDA